MLAALCQEHDLFNERDGVVRLPFLVKGRLVVPPQVSRAEIEAAFAAAGEGATYAKTAGVQLLKAPLIERRRMALSGEVQVQVLPAIGQEGAVQIGDLLEPDMDELVNGLYALSVDEVIAYLQALAAAWQANMATVASALELARRTSEHPDLFLNGAFLGLQLGLDPQAARAMIDAELACWGIPGSRFLEGWVELPAQPIAGLSSSLAQGLEGGAPAMPDLPVRVRAMPTRQLHITAGNAPEVPLISALRAVLTKSPALVKSPAAATLSGALFALLALAVQPEHPITRHLSLVYWPGGDESIESQLFAPGNFERIVVWGDHAAVTSVQSRALFSRVVAFNPRYGVSLVGRQAFAGDLQAVVRLAAQDSLIYNQKACTAAQVHYVEGDEAQAQEYARCLQGVLAGWDRLAPQHVPPAVRGQLRRLQRGRYARAQWLLNTTAGGDDFASGVVLMPESFDILDHPLCRLVVVRRLDDLAQALRYIHAGVSTVGVYPEARRLELRDLIAARGASNVLPLGQCERLFPGQPHDGMLVLSQLVDWKNG